MNQSTISG
jgi:hypothetical protein